MMDIPIERSLLPENNQEKAESFREKLIRKIRGRDIDLPLWAERDVADWMIVLHGERLLPDISRGNWWVFDNLAHVWQLDNDNAVESVAIATLDEMIELTDRHGDDAAKRRDKNTLVRFAGTASCINNIKMRYRAKVKRAGLEDSTRSEHS